MNSKEAIERIKAVLGISNHNFGSYKIKEGGEFKIDGELEMGKEIYIITEEGELPSPDGEFQIEDGTSVKIKDGKIEEIIEVKEELEDEVKEEEMEDDKKEEEMEEEEKEKLEDEEKEKEMASVSLIDGTIVGNDEEELSVGQDLFVITEEGKTKAPDGEHETEDGKVVVVEEGKIKEIKDKEEVVVEEDVALSEVIGQFTLAIESLNKEINSIKNENEELRNKFSAFSNEPAGDRIYNSKNLQSERFSQRTDRLTALSQLRKK